MSSEWRPGMLVSSMCTMDRWNSSISSTPFVFSSNCSKRVCIDLWQAHSQKLRKQHAFSNRVIQIGVDILKPFAHSLLEIEGWKVMVLGQLLEDQRRHFRERMAFTVLATQDVAGKDGGIQIITSQPNFILRRARWFCLLLDRIAYGVCKSLPIWV